MEPRVYRDSLMPFEATRLQKVSSSLSNLAMISPKVENITNLYSMGDEITSVDVAHLMYAHVCLEEPECRVHHFTCTIACGLGTA